ncbi:MAG TPA: HAMP domain-containing sensor histidine kinase [Pantanalinema sp.]
MIRALRRRLSAYYLSVLALILVGYGLGVYGATRAVLLRGFDDVNRHAIADVAGKLARAGGDLEEQRHELDEIGLEHEEHLALLDPRGHARLIRGTPLTPEPPLRPGISTYPARADRPAMRMLVVPLEHHGVLHGYLRIGQSLTETDHALRALGIALALMVPLGLSIAWLGGRWLIGIAAKPLEEALERERQFTRDASHELRTPLAVILAHAQLGLTLPELGAAARDKLELIVATARKMNALLADLLALGRIDAGGGGSSLRFSLLELVEEEVEAFMPLAQARHVSLSLAPQPDGAWIHGDPARIGQVTRNLLDNAIRYTPPGGSVKANLRLEHGAVCLDVTNTGSAISSEQRKLVFERFHRLEAGRAANPDGSGLGLSIARAIARAHGGELSLLESTERATTFRLRLPRRQGHPPDQGGRP